MTMPAAPRRRSAKPPSRHLERELLNSGHALVAGMDEVGRGALAGPVSVGVAVVDATTGRMPAGLRDSKLLTAGARDRLCAPIRRWSLASAVGHAGPDEIDRWGIMAALRLAGQRALHQVAGQGWGPAVVILDGHYDWLSADQESVPAPAVVTQIKGDLRCTVVAAASVLAKCARDELMIALHQDYPDYGFADNKGYSAPDHLRALARSGPAQVHRRSWALPGVAGEQGVLDLGQAPVGPAQFESANKA